jgi:hypothetical protein
VSFLAKSALLKDLNPGQAKTRALSAFLPLFQTCSRWVVHQEKERKYHVHTIDSAADASNARVRQLVEVMARAIEAMRWCVGFSATRAIWKS